MKKKKKKNKKQNSLKDKKQSTDPSLVVIQVIIKNLENQFMVEPNIQDYEHKIVHTFHLPINIHNKIHYQKNHRFV